MEVHGSINHVAITVSNLQTAMQFFSPLFEALGYTVGQPMRYGETDLTVNVHETNGTAVNIWQAKTPHAFDPYEPGLHHLAFNAASVAEVDRIHALVAQAGARVLDGPAQFPFAHRGYYAVYFLGPDNIKIEVVHMAGLASAVAAGHASEA
jgi:glyoxylase I family protein